MTSQPSCSPSQTFCRIVVKAYRRPEDTSIFTGGVRSGSGGVGVFFFSFFFFPGFIARSSPVPLCQPGQGEPIWQPSVAPASSGSYVWKTRSGEGSHRGSRLVREAARGPGAGQKVLVQEKRLISSTWLSKGLNNCAPWVGLWVTWRQSRVYQRGERTGGRAVGITEKGCVQLLMAAHYICFFLCYEGRNILIYHYLRFTLCCVLDSVTLYANINPDLPLCLLQLQQQRRLEHRRCNPDMFRFPNHSTCNIQSRVQFINFNIPILSLLQLCFGSWRCYVLLCSPVTCKPCPSVIRCRAGRVFFVISSG